MHKKVQADMNFGAREQKVLDFWRQENIFERSKQERAGCPKFTFFDGPPTANGRPHIGHILTRSIKDIIPRFKTMRGYDVLRKAGWDTHGLPVELEVEKTLGLDGKQQIEAYGVQPFIEECKKSVWKYLHEWEAMSERVGFWVDMNDPYVTYHNNYIESVWWSLKQIFDKGLLYKGHKVVPYCPRCGTALSSHEVAQGYKEVEETSVIVRFFLEDEAGALLAWTTTPWTLPSNVAVCVHPTEPYVMVEHDGERLILAAALVKSIFGEDADVKEIWRKPGAQLAGTKYKPLFDFQTENAAYYVVADEYVTMDEGTGIVHTAPAFGEDDARLARDNKLPFVQLVDTRGRLTAPTPWEGTFAKAADPEIIALLDKQGNLFAALPMTHSYPFCWRCDTPLLYYARASWFIRMTAVKEQLIAANRSVNWLPDNIKEGRMGNFLENVVDWGLSRERYWGTPLPIWLCECGHIHTVGSIAELKALCPDCPEDIELHKPYIDELQLKCPKCGATMTRTPEVIDCWYDSGSMPFAQWHYPFENKEQFEARFPAQFISEAVDQTRGWFYTLLAISTCLFEKAPFQNCVVMGHVQDKEGRKMSKSKGNVVDPWTVLNAQGADAVRWYFYVSSMPWLPNRFYTEAVSETQRKFMGTLYNTYAFYVLYAQIDGFDATQHTLDADKLSMMDKWVLSRLNSTVTKVTDFLENYRITEAARELTLLVDELSNWYVRRGRRRYWGSELTDDKLAAYMTLYTVLETITRMSAPFVPFMAEDIYQNLVRTLNPDAPISVHFCDYPVCDTRFIDAGLETRMQAVLDIVTMGRACRNTSGRKNRQPLRRMYVQGAGTLSDAALEIIRGELNVKVVEVTEDAGAFIEYKVKPQLKTLGPRYGKLLGGIRKHMEKNAAAIVADVAQGEHAFEVNGTQVVLAADDVLIETLHKEGFVSESANGLSVVLDIALDDELIREGIVRELVSKVQTMRKEHGLEVTDHITLAVAGSQTVIDLVEASKGDICADVLCDGICPEITADMYAKEWDLNGHAATLGIQKA